MHAGRAFVVALAVVIVGLMLLPPGTTGVAPRSAATPAPGPSVGSASTPTQLTAAASVITQRAETVNREANIPAAARLEPNLGYSSVREGTALVPANLADGQVSPGPTSIGVNDLGLRTNSAGDLVPYSYRTTSLVGTVTIDSMSLLPVMANVSNGITVQENAVLNNVTVFGQSVDQIWAQNVILYSVTGHELQLLTDAWNFTGPPFSLPQSSIYANSPGGYDFGGVYVHQVPLTPPAYIVQMPFTIRLYLNATNVDGRNALYFNYTLSSASDMFLDGRNLGTSIQDGSFDWIIFNSRAGQPKGYTAPPASFLISGSEATGLGLANDAEIAICGPSDGYSADIRAMSATAQLQYLNGTTSKYTAVPAAFTTTEDTGESVEGVDAHFTSAGARSGTAILSAGPEFVYGLWNATPGPERQYTVDLSAPAGQLWVAPVAGPEGSTTFSNDSAAWAIGTTADLTFWLPTGPGLHYNGLALANGYDPKLVALLTPGGTDRVSLAPNAARGVYVPVIAFGNDQVAELAAFGDGSAAFPYVIALHQDQPISSLYATYDEFGEPIYPGLLFSGVTAHVDLVGLPSFRIDLSATDLFPLQYFWGLNPPTTNDLPIEVYDSSNLSIVGASGISGWFPVLLTGFLYGSLYLSDVTHSLVAYNDFSSMGSSMVIVDPQGNRTQEDNTVFGNVFRVNPVVYGPNGSTLYLAYGFETGYTGGPAVGGLGVLSSGNTIYNNLFDTPIGAYSPPQNPLLAYVFINDLGYQDSAQVATTWTNRWNISLEPASYTNWVNGFALTGNVVGAAFEGGNAWAGWNSTVPYTSQNLIPTGGDSLPIPLPGQSVHALLFREVGLPGGTAWSVVANGAKYGSTQPLMIVYLTNGPARITVPPAGGRVANPNAISVTVTKNLVYTIRFG